MKSTKTGTTRNIGENRNDNMDNQKRKCAKCGIEEGTLVYRNKGGSFKEAGYYPVMISPHHKNGYLGENLYVTVDYCKSCDLKAHIKAKKEGRCNLTSRESFRLSLKSYQKRNYEHIKAKNRLYKNKNTKTIMFCKDYVVERIDYNNKTGSLFIYSYFQPHNLKKSCIEKNISCL